VSLSNLRHWSQPAPNYSDRSGFVAGEPASGQDIVFSNHCAVAIQTLFDMSLNFNVEIITLVVEFLYERRAGVVIGSSRTFGAPHVEGCLW
jgi:hypothetical protein